MATASVHSEEMYANTYKIGKKQGIAVIINNRKIKNYAVRNTTKDQEFLMLRLKNFDFDIQAYENLTAKEIKDVMHKAAASDHTENACFMCIVMSYGDEGTIYGTDTTLQVQNLLEPFKGNNCTSLVTKPKIFVLQASPLPCEEYKDNYETELIPPKNIEIRIPIEADFFVAYSVVPDFLPYPKSKEYDGSWFIQAICKTFKALDSKHLDLMSMFIKVNRQVAKDYEKNAEKEFKKGKKIPCVTTTLIKEFYFNCGHPDKRMICKT